MHPEEQTLCGSQQHHYYYYLDGGQEILSVFLNERSEVQKAALLGFFFVFLVALIHV